MLLTNYLSILYKIFDTSLNLERRGFEIAFFIILLWLWFIRVRFVRVSLVFDIN
jgi:hypothetical protein